ncbi:MAG: flagellar filament outer layer protein FlaA [Spirochaetota bacterium]
MIKPRISILIIVLLLVIPVAASAQYFGQIGREEYRIEDIRSIILDDFETTERNWQVSASSFKAEGFPEIKTQVEGAPLALKGTDREQQPENQYVIGVRAAFTRKGYNSIQVYPEEEIVIPGFAKKISVWVWGANYYYNMEVHLRDYRGIVHKLSMGSLHFKGWRNLSVEIPKRIPQEIRYLPTEKPLSLVRFAIWTEPGERVDDYMVYFDQLKVLTDMYRQRFDGDVLADRSEEIWQTQ